MRLRRYLVRRVLQIIPVILIVVVINFVLIQLAPGDVALIMAGENPDPEYIRLVRIRYGLDRPIHEQLFIYLGRIIRGDLGHSYIHGRPVMQVIAERIPATLLLVLSSLLVAVVIGTMLGTVLARRLGSRLDVAASVAAVVSYSVPIFWLGLMCILLFAVRLRWLPASGMFTIVGAPEHALGRAVDLLRHMALPAFTLSTVYLGQFLRLARSSVGQVLNEDFILVSRAIGFSENTILLKYALRNALLPVVTVLGLQLGLILAGAVLTETVFAWPGLGRLVYESILSRDTPLIVGAYIVVAVCVAAASLATDMVYAYLDPRVGYK